jgi:hypothetical protein
MPTAGEQAPTPEPNFIDIYRAYSLETKSRLNATDYVLSQTEELLAHGYDTVNTQLEQAGRPDLAIETPVAMMPLERPEEILSNKYGNFGPLFVMYVDIKLVGVNEEVIKKPQAENLPISHDELLNMRQLPRFQAPEEYEAALREHEDYGIIKGFNHARKAAFIRMLTLMPDFTSELVLGVSSADNEHRRATFEPQIAAAYHVMSSLVDQNDMDVLRDGLLDEYYLCR